MVGSRRQGWAIYAAMLVLFVAGVVIVSLSEDGRTAAMQAAGARRLEHGGQGDALRHRLVVAVRRRHDRRVVRRGQRGDGVADRLRRRDPDGEHDDRRGHLRRRRLGPLRDAAVRPARGVPRRPDGRAARRSTSARRSARARSSSSRSGRSPCRCSCSSSRRSRSRPTTARRRSSTPARRASASRSTPTPRRPTTTARRSPATPAFLQPNGTNDGALTVTFANVVGGAGDALRALPADARRARRRRRARRQEGRRRRARARCAPTRRRSSSCSSRRS